MKLGKPTDERVIVTIKTASRDDREKVEGKPNPSFGKVVYETHKSIDVFDATAQQIEKIVFDALSAKSEK